jgi:hypothetical protein
MERNIWKLKSPSGLERKLVHFHLNLLQSGRGFEVLKVAQEFVGIITENFSVTRTGMES